MILRLGIPLPVARVEQRVRVRLQVPWQSEEWRTKGRENKGIVA